MPFHSCRQAEARGLVRILEVVDIAPIAWDRLLAGRLLNKPFDSGQFSCARCSGDKYVVAVGPDAEAELDGFYRAVLPDDNLIGSIQRRETLHQLRIANLSYRVKTEGILHTPGDNVP